MRSVHQAAEHTWRRRQVETFVAVRCRRAANLKCSTAELYGAYSIWAQSLLCQCMSHVAFGRALKELKVTSAKRNTMWWQGLGLLPDAVDAGTGRPSFLAGDEPPIPAPTAGSVADVSSFLSDFCILDATGRERASDLFTAYAEAMAAEGRTSVSQVAFGRALRQAGFVSIKRSVQYWQGVRLRRSQADGRPGHLYGR